MMDPMANDTDVATGPASRAPVVLRIILSVVLLVPGVIGIVMLAGLTGIWVYEGFRFLDSDAGWMPLFIIPALVFVLFSVATVGIVLRFARWRRARAASLVLAIASAVSVVISYQLLLDSFSADDGESPLIALAACVAGLLFASGPTFLHWWNGRDREQNPRS